MGNTRKILMGASALAGAFSIALFATQASAETKPIAFDLPAQPLGESLRDFYRESGEQIVFSEDLVAGRTGAALKGDYTPDQALAMLLEGTSLTARRTSTGVVMIEAPQSGSVAGGGADAGTVQALIVTAQKKEEQIQDVPIAISAFTEKALEEQKIEGGFDLLKAIPNVTFSKNNFTSYNFSIRGIGTKAVSATTDPGVAVAFNDAALIQNRLFEQEYFDVERVEVLRGPQGTLYGRNATAGVINVISAKPNMSEFSGSLKGEVGNYHAKRMVAVINVPLIEDKLAIRLAGSLTERQGYDFNDITQHAVNGRDLWSARVTVGFNPTEHIRTSLVWERFNEDDNRSRTGKQLCNRDPGKAMIGSAPVQDAYGQPNELVRAAFSQGCRPVSLYDDTAYQTPNGLSLPFIFAYQINGQFRPLGWDSSNHQGVSLIGPVSFTRLPADPYANRDQTHDLRVISSIRDPIYGAKADIIQFNADFELPNTLVLTSQTAYDGDSVYSFQDYNRFNTQPIFADTSNILDFDPNKFDYVPGHYRGLAPGGIYCDPQIGCSNRMAGFDISKAKSTQFLQEFRLQSAFQGPLNFSAGVNYTRFRVLVDYYVMINALTGIAQSWPFNYQPDITKCNVNAAGYGYGGVFGLPYDTVYPIDAPQAGCPYIDPNPVEKINGEGHNYFRSKNPYKLSSSAAFGELYWKKSDNLKFTLGLRYTDDRKTFTPVPSQLLLSTLTLAGGDVNRGYPELPDIKQHWGELTGRFGVDWKPDLSFTDQTMIYAFYSRGYKGGGANPPPIGYSKRWISDLLGLAPGTIPALDRPVLEPKAQNTSPTFKPEFVNAFEVGAKNTLMGGALVLNSDAFFYDYKDYQVSKIVDRTAVNENFDAKVWGLEFQTTFAANRDLQFIANLGYLGTAIGRSAKSIDIMNRTQGNPNYVLVKPWIQYPSNCVLPKSVVESELLYLDSLGGGIGPLVTACGQFGLGILQSLSTGGLIDVNTGQPYMPDTYPELNGGAGLYQNLKGNELPNSPHWTMNIGGQYTFHLSDNWTATIRGDGYWQSQSWARVYNAVNDKLHGWYNANLSLWLECPDDGLKIELYAKNILDKTPITDSFINSDDSGLTTNVFVLDPRLIGLSIKKEF